MSSINNLKFKRSDVPGFVPLSNQLLDGELFINSADKKIYTKAISGEICCIGKVTININNEVYIPKVSFGNAPNYGAKGTILVSGSNGVLMPLQPGGVGQCLVARSSSPIGIAWETAV